MTRVLLTGATGFAGGATLTRLLADEAVTAVTAVSRRPLAVDDARLTVVLHQDFGSWDAAELTELAGHDACVWVLGAKASDVASDGDDPDRYARITHDHLRFCYLSGMGATPREDVRLPWERRTRLAKGRTEHDLRALAARSRGVHVTCFRPGGILPTTTSPLLRGLTRPIAVDVDELAAALTVVATGAAPGLPDVLHNRDIRRLAAGVGRPVRSGARGFPDRS